MSLGDFKKFIKNMRRSPPVEDIDLIKLVFKDVTKDFASYQRIRYVLNENNLHRLYEYIPEIYGMLREMPVMSEEIEDKLIKMFEEFGPSTLSHSFLVHKFLLILREDDLAEQVPYLRSDMKIAEANKIFSKFT